MKGKITILLLIFLQFSFIYSGEEKEAPTFYLMTLDGNDFFLSEQLEKGNPIVLSFFATWCGPCIKEMPIIDSLASVYRDVDFYFVNVNGIKGYEPETPSGVKKLMKLLDINLPVLMDRYMVTAKKYDAFALPTTVVINSNGKIAYHHIGYTSGDEIKLIKELDNFTGTDE